MKRKKRLAGRLSTTSDQKQPNHLLFFDTETHNHYISDTQKEQHLTLGVARYVYREAGGNIKSRQDCIFRNTDELMTFIESKVHAKKKILIFAHNIAFDIMVTNLPKWFKENRVTPQPFIRNGMVFVWSVRYESRSLTFINTGNFTPYRLSQIAKDLGMEKLLVEFETVGEQELIEYCTMDVAIIEKLILSFIQFLEDNQLGAFKSTLASQALTAYTTRFNKNLPYTTDINGVLDLEKEAYKGGRTECFKIGRFNHEKIYYTDINSMYPYVMTGDLIPKRFIRGMVNPPINRTYETMKHRYIIARCKLQTPLPFIATLFNPLKYKITNSTTTPKDSKLIFPIGEFEVVLHHAELEYAIENGFVQSISQALMYERGEIFNDYVNFFTDMKIQATIDGNRVNRLMAKLFLNSLYGKFGQRHKSFNLIEESPDIMVFPDKIYNDKGEIISSEFLWFGERWENITQGWANHSIPAIAGAVTSKARMLLWYYALEVGLENLYYTDTDSLMVNAIGYDKLKDHIDDTKLGYLKLEKTADELIINGCKDYRFDGKRTLKGVPTNATEISPQTYEYEHFEGAGQWQRRGMDTPPRITLMQKTKRSPYDKAHVNPDGTVEPFVLKYHHS